MKNVAIYLTGLISDRTFVLPHLKKCIDEISNKLNINVDYYCHFWDTTKKYLYNIDDSDLILSIESENSENINAALDIFKPVDYYVASFVDYAPCFYNVIKLDINDPLSYKDSIYLKTYRDFDINYLLNETVDYNFFMRNHREGKRNAGQLYNHWWELHSLWCSFVLEASQCISMVNSNKMIINSKKEYDACIKLRYDLLFDYHNPACIAQFEKILKSVAENSNTIFAENIWNKVPDQIIPEDSLDINHFYCVTDSWFAHDMSSASIISESVKEHYCNTMEFRLSEWNSQHAYFYRAFRRSNLTIKTTGPIHDVIIRNTMKIPGDFHSNTQLHYHNLLTEFNDYGMSIDSNKVYNNNDQTAKYFTAKNFNFDRRS